MITLKDNAPVEKKGDVIEVNCAVVDILRRSKAAMTVYMLLRREAGHSDFDASMRGLSRVLNITPQTVGKIMKHLAAYGLIEEAGYGRIYVYEYPKILAPKGKPAEKIKKAPEGSTVKSVMGMLMKKFKLGRN